LLATLPRHLHTYLLLIFSPFNPASESESHKILSNCPNKQSDSDPIHLHLPVIVRPPYGASTHSKAPTHIPTWLLKKHLSLSPQYLILSIYHSLPVSSTPFSKNRLLPTVGLNIIPFKQLCIEDHFTTAIGSQNRGPISSTSLLSLTLWTIAS